MTARVHIFALASDGIVCMSFSLRAWSQARAGIEREWEVYSVHLEGDLA